MLKIAHRGASGAYPENTLLAFDKALASGANALECDVHACKSGEAIVIHDDTLERTTNGTGKVADHTLAELKKLDAGGGQTIPTLHEVLERYASKAAVFIETKDAGVAEAVAHTVTHFTQREHIPYAQMPVISFYAEHLQTIRSINPKILTGLTPAREDAKNPADFITRATALRMWSINPDIRFLQPEHVTAAHEAGLKVISWTANSQEEIQKAYALGVDGIMSDWPERL